jgi:hypothetical protein
LFSAIAASPSDEEMRLQYISAAFAAGQNDRALLAAEPVIANGSFYGPRYSQGYNSYENENEDNESRQNLPSIPALKPEEANKLTWLAIHAREKRHEADVALTLARSALSSEKDASRRHALEEEQKRLETEAALVAENAARAPNIHKDLDQDRVVRPRLLPGEPFIPRKTANNGEDAE